MPDIARDPAFLTRRRLRRIGFAMAVALGLITVSIAVARMEPASPTADAATVLRDTVKRGSFIHTVRGSGTLVPEPPLLALLGAGAVLLVGLGISMGGSRKLNRS